MNNYSITTRRIRTTMWKIKTGTESSMTQMLMTTEMTTLHRTSPLAWHCTTERAHVVLFLAHFITLTLAEVLPALHIHLHAIHGCLSLTRPTPLSTSQPSSCLSSSSPSSTSATSSSRSSTRRSWKTCATPPTTGVRAPTTSSTSPHLVCQ